MVASSPHRTSIVALHARGHTPANIARTLGIPRSTVSRTLSRFNLTGQLKDRPRSGRPRSVLTPQLRKVVKQKIDRNPRRSMNKMASEAGISRRTMQRLVNEDLELHSYRTRKAAILSVLNKQRRLTRCRALLERTRSENHHTWIFSDEKLFNVGEVFNPQNTRVLATDTEDADAKGRTIHTASHPAQVMV